MNYSVVLIARNEQKTLPRLMASLSEFQERGGEVVIVDTGSSDKTAEVARSLGAKVEEVGDRFKHSISQEQAEQINAWSEEGDIVKEGETLFDFASARNYAASLASNQMVWMPDADEAFTKLDLDAIEKAIKEGAEQLEYDFTYSHDEFGRPAIQFLHSKAYDRRKVRWAGIVHEVLVGEAKRQYLPPSVAKLEHFQNRETNRDGYLKGLALDVLLNPDNDRNLHYFGRELLWKGKPRTAIKLLERHIAMDRWKAEKAQSLVLIGDAHQTLGNDKEAKRSWFEAYQAEPSRRIGLLRLAETAYKSRDAKQTVALIEALLTIPYNGFYADDKAHYTNLPHEWAYWAYWELGDRKKAKEHWQKAYQYAPEHPVYSKDLQFFLPKVSVILPQLGREAGLERAKRSIENLNYPKELVELIVDDRAEPTVPEKVKAMKEKSTGAYLLFASNDIEFSPECLMEAVKASCRTGKGLVALNTGVEKDNEGRPVCEHFLIRKDLLPEIGGDIFDLSMNHVGVDTLLWNKCETLNQAHWEREAKAEHFHFTRGKEMDWVYERGWKHAEEDRKKLSHKMNLLRQGVSPALV